MTDNIRWGIKPWIYGAYAAQGGRVSILGIKVMWVTDSRWWWREVEIWRLIAWRTTEHGTAIRTARLEINLRRASGRFNEMTAYQKWRSRRAAALEVRGDQS